jgi:hypothetical protein
VQLRSRYSALKGSQRRPVLNGSMWMRSIPQQFMYAELITVFILARNLPMMALLARHVGPT